MDGGIVVTIWKGQCVYADCEISDFVICQSADGELENFDIFLMGMKTGTG